MNNSLLADSECNQLDVEQDEREKKNKKTEACTEQELNRIL